MTFKFTDDDAHKLFDLFHMINWDDYQETLEINKMDKWTDIFFERLWDYCVPEVEDLTLK